MGNLILLNKHIHKLLLNKNNSSNKQRYFIRYYNRHIYVMIYIAINWKGCECHFIAFNWIVYGFISEFDTLNITTLNNIFHSP